MEPLVWNQLDAGRLDVALKQPNGSPRSLAGCVLSLTVKRSYSDTDEQALVAIDITEFDDESGGLAHFDIEPSTNPEIGQFVFDVQLTDAGGKPFTLFGGGWIVVPRATRRVPTGG